MVRLTADLIYRSPQFTNCVRERELDLRGNKLLVIENLGATLDSYDCLNFSDNEITRLENFPRLKQLTTILLNNNHVSRIEPGLGAKLPALDTLVLTHNKVSSLAEIDNLSSLSTLRELSLLHNPVTKREHYRLYVIHTLPNLKVLDFSKVKVKEREAAARLFASASGKKLVQAVEEAKTFTPGEAPTSSEPAATDYTPEQRAAMIALIGAASTPAEVDRLERFMKQGKLPPELQTNGAAGAGAGAAAPPS